MIYSAMSHVGIKRQNNEDSYLVNVEDGNNLFIVADGMGGHNAGEVASMEACRIIESHILSSKGSFSDKLCEAVQKANREIFIRASEEEEKRGMGTTIDACIKNGNTLYIAHVGDSRVYAITKSSIEKITKDHSVVGMMVDSGSITDEEARVHPQRNLITRAVGTGMTVEVDVVKYEAVEKTTILLCTDGLSNMVSKNDIFSIVTNSENVEDAVRKLIDKANENGGEDNITAILLEMGEEVDR